MWQAALVHHNVLIGGLIGALAGAGFMWLVALLPYRGLKGVPLIATDVSEELALLFFAALLGIVTGIIAGYSRQPAVTAVLPAVLTFVGALVGLLFSSSSSANRFPLLVAAVTLVLFFYGGIFTGAALRGPWDEVQANAEMIKMQYAADIEKDRMRFDAELKR